jgi:hypothetical protein
MPSALSEALELAEGMDAHGYDDQDVMALLDLLSRAREEIRSAEEPHDPSCDLGVDCSCEKRS